MIHDQDGLLCPYTCIVNTIKSFLLYNHWADWYVASGPLLLYDDPGSPSSLKGGSNLFP